jgi:quinol-cytochrome oxidoreductase complex cytochrome b subunit
MSAPDLTPQGGDVSPTDAGQDAPTHGRMPGALAWVANRLGMEELMEDQYNRIVPIHATNYIYCFGGIAFILFLILAVTGILLVVYYQPTPDGAYQSVVNISTNVAFGWWIRSIHKWAATGMVVLVFVHLLRVFFTSAYKRPRELNWISGVVLLMVTMAFGFTGYLLPWDQKAYWATRVGTDIAGSTPFIGHFLLVSLRGGENITGATLGRFFDLHVLVLPVVIVVFLGAHFWMIRRHGISGRL